MSVTAANRKYFVDVFQDWCVEVRALYDPLIEGVGLKTPYSYYGSILEIVNYLNIKSENTLPRYPMIALVDNEGMKQKKGIDWYEVSPVIYIFSETIEKYDPQQRYDNVIKPILFKIKEYLQDVIEFSELVSPANESTDEIEIFKGSLNGSTIPDAVDCIKLSISNLRINNNC
jgi:hypothetical protein